MATNIVPSLFGMTPQMYQQGQQDRIDAQALRYAQLDPFQQAQYGLVRGGNMLGGAIGGALGGQDPELQRITMRQQIARQLNPNDPASIQQAIAMMQQSGDAEGAMMLQDEYRKMQESTALIGQRQASAAASTAAAGRERTQASPKEAQLADLVARRAGPEGSPEYQAAFNASLDAQMAPKPSAPNIKEIGVTQGSGLPVYLDANTDQQFVFGTDPATGAQIRKPYVGAVDRTTAKTSIKVSADTIGENEFSKTLGAADAKRVDTALTLRDSSLTTLTSLNELSKLDDSGLISGSFATGRVGATNLLNTLGLASPKDQVRLSNSENYTKEAGTVILGVLGGRLGAGFSNEDRKFIEGLVPKLENSAMARRQLIDFMVKKNTDVVNETTRLEDYARKNKGLNGFKPTIPLVSPSTSQYSNLSDAELADRIKAAQAKK